ncbi:MAG: hypothetical protein IJ081_03090 [Prevotella sp.]|nr:hypothetical protein [Bacteroidaceae bacterium]MBQ8157990.1 hypothetical protein [Prevotella sp.]
MPTLPTRYEKLYKSAYLKTAIADDGMWNLIPSVTGSMDSVQGARRMKENHVLFTFIDTYFPDGPFAFEPNMQDGRFVFLPAVVDHQGIGICASMDVPGFLDIGHFWYPWEFTENDTAFHVDQVWVCMYKTNLFDELAETVKRWYFREDSASEEKFCTFPFGPQHVVRLEGDFLDRMNSSIRAIRAELKDADPMVQRNGEGLIQFMKRVVGK